MTQLIPHAALNISTTAVAKADSGALGHVGDQDQQTEFSGLLSDSHPLSNMLKKLRERLTEDEYLVVEPWLTGGESLPQWEEVAGEIVPLFAGNIDLFTPRIRERIQQLAYQLSNTGQQTQKSWQELKGLLQQQLTQPGNNSATTPESEFFDATLPQPNPKNPSLTFMSTALKRNLQEDGSAGMINVLSTMGSTGAETARSLPVVPVGGLLTSSQPSAGVLGVPLGEPGWNQALGRQIQWMIGSKIQSASLKITPPHLGPIEIKLSVKNDQADILFAAQHTQVREALESAIPRLREMFGEISLDLVNVNVGKKEAESQQQFSALVSDQNSEGDQTENGNADTQDSAEAAQNVETNVVVSGGGSILVDDYA